MDPNIENLVSLATNVGFPVTLCFVLLRYVLQTMGEKLDKLDSSLNKLCGLIKEIDARADRGRGKEDKNGTQP
ncbi:hypothetical protein PC41400_15650 [Paenibacillus chitinolyticus]|uniref:YvrJ family protein n=1 Tax=Paenibacillus chitinolyticus TaxID=79263 RepID=A0A410WX22_9BACL|nr:hypothetical protein [Paenibacillus chitinolyticus]MCY9589656.1 hypothetical protein [Paenibacillus chitinolyticus]MCY9598344.1 hypothetical protein [Paenibacillus chitinolyticus]QAV19036.1 hypothetical protein PC41400_15650 [Paenibacillus chitinolyticus]